MTQQSLVVPDSKRPTELVLMCQLRDEQRQLEAKAMRMYTTSYVASYSDKLAPMRRNARIAFTAFCPRENIDH